MKIPSLSFLTRFQINMIVYVSKNSTIIVLRKYRSTIKGKLNTKIKSQRNGAFTLGFPTSDPFKEMVKRKLIAYQKTAMIWGN